MKKKLLLLTLALLLVAGMAGAGTFAYFQDTESSTGNTFTAGTFDLVISDGSSLPFSGSTQQNIAPGWSHSEEQGIQNVGSLPGEVWVTAENFVEPTGLYQEPPEPEPSIEVGPRDFADIVYMKVWADTDHNWSYDNNELIYDGCLRHMETAKFSIGPGEAIMLKFEAYLPADLNDHDNDYEDTQGGIPAIDGNEDDNAYQADGVKCNITFYGTTEITLGGD